MSRVVHFEIQADEVKRAKTFYAAVFGWSFEDYSTFTGSNYWGVVTGPEDQPGINGGLLQRPCPAPALGQGVNGFVCTMGVDEYDETERRILDAGEQVALAKMALAGMAWQGRATTSTPRATLSKSTSPTPRLPSQESTPFDVPVASG